MFDPARIYAHDLAIAAICTEMSRTGMGINTAIARAHAETLYAEELKARAQVCEALGVHLKATKTGGIGSKELHDIIFNRMRTPVYYRSNKTGRPSLGKLALQAYLSSSNEVLANFAAAEMRRKSVRDTRKKYIEDVLAIQLDSRVYPIWQNTGAITGRFSCKSPNLMNLSRPENDPTVIWDSEDKTARKQIGGGIRQMYEAPDGYMLVWLDVGQIDMRVAAYASGDDVMIGACENVELDIHSANAAVVFGPRFLTLTGPARKHARTLAKSAGLAAIYLAGAPRLSASLHAAGAPTPMNQCEAMLNAIHTKCAAYFKWQEARLAQCMREGYSYSPLLGRRRWFGHDIGAIAAEVINYPIQSGAADVMNAKLLLLDRRLRSLDCRLVAQVHDSCVWECNENEVAALQAIANETFAEPVMFEDRKCTMPIDWEVSKTWH